MPVSNYLPESGSLVRFRAEQPDSKCSSPTRLVLVDQLPQLAAANPRAKISATYAALVGGENDEHVVAVTAVAIDLDIKPGFATAAQVAQLRDRFPAAALVWSNGVTMLYHLHGLPWEFCLVAAYQVAREAEVITGLGYDVTTHFKNSGQPGRQRNHLFRYPAGWASRRNAPVGFFDPADPTKDLISDCVGVDHPLIQPPPPKIKRKAAELVGVGDLFGE